VNTKLRGRVVFRVIVAWKAKKPLLARVYTGPSGCAKLTYRGRKTFVQSTAWSLYWSLVWPSITSRYNNEDDEYGFSRDSVVVALGELKDSAAIPILLEALYDKSINVRSRAAWALGEIGSDAVPGLIKALHDEPPGIDNQIAGALVKIGEPAVPELDAILQSGEGVIKRKAINILRQIGTPQALATIKARHYKG